MSEADFLIYGGMAMTIVGAFSAGGRVSGGITCVIWGLLMIAAAVHAVSKAAI